MKIEPYSYFLKKEFSIIYIYIGYATKALDLHPQVEKDDNMYCFVIVASAHHCNILLMNFCNSSFLSHTLWNIPSSFQSY